jgi:hypothetical protein
MTLQFIDVSKESAASFRAKRGITFLDSVGAHQK